MESTQIYMLYMHLYMHLYRPKRTQKESQHKHNQKGAFLHVSKNALEMISDC